MTSASRSSKRQRIRGLSAFVSVVILLLAPSSAQAQESAKDVLSDIDFARGVCAILGLPTPGGADLVTDVARASELLVYFQAADKAAATAVRNTAEAAGLLGVRIFVGDGGLDRIGLAANIAGAVLVSPSAHVEEQELLRILHPGGKIVGGTETIVKPRPEGVDSWTHVYHRADNNPQSTDRVARAPYLTQFLADPKFCPMPEVSVAAGGRVLVEK